MAHPGRLILRRISLGFGLLAVAAVASADFAPLTDQERALTSVPGYPEAPAVVLFKKAAFSVFNQYGRYVPTLTVSVRRKILTAEGSQRYGEVILRHSRQVRLRGLEARTVLPDGRVIPLPKDATFKRRTSRADRTFVTSIAFPAVAVGAVLDCKYEIQLGFGFFIEPWYFQEEVPTLHSEITYLIPREIVVSSLAEDPMHTGIRQKSTQTVSGVRVEAWGDNLPPIPAEEHSVPYSDVASSFIVIPTTAGSRDLFKDWASTCKLYAKAYERARRKSREAERKGREIAAAVPGGGRRDKARALYRFVRDEIHTEEAWGVALPEDATADSVLAARSGDPAEKALLLQSLLAGAGIDSRAVWAADRMDGLINMKLATPLWFDRWIVMLFLDGRRIFLDPADRSLAFGHLSPMVEGMPALLYDAEKPEVLQLPLSPFAESTRLAQIELSLDASGRLRGTGKLRLTGHHAWDRLHWKDDAAATLKAWEEWLTGKFSGQAISLVRVDEQVDEQRVEVSWAMAEREEEVLGDEASLVPSRPLGPLQQPFVQKAEKRLTGVLFRFADRDEVELTLHWPAGWVVEAPPETRYQNAAGAVITELSVNEAAHLLIYRRRFDTVQRELTKDSYPAAQALYGVLERQDAKTLTLVRKEGGATPP